MRFCVLGLGLLRFPPGPGGFLGTTYLLSDVLRINMALASRAEPCDPGSVRRRKEPTMKRLIAGLALVASLAVAAPAAARPPGYELKVPHKECAKFTAHFADGTARVVRVCFTYPYWS